MNPDRTDDYSRYLAGLLAGDAATCRAVAQAWLDAAVPLPRLYEDLIQRSLYDVGLLWERGRISVADEHLASAISEGVMALAYPRLFALPRVNHSALITCAANEQHQIGAKMVADLFEMRGWRGFFLGANAPYRDVLDLIAARRPEVACLSLTVFFNLDKFIELAETIRAAYPELPILVGGQALRVGGRERAERIADTRYLGSLAELDAWIAGYEATAVAP
jgi:methanogenic corrinoid protein MtbC1